MPDNSEENPYASPNEPQATSPPQVTQSGTPVHVQGWFAFLFGFSMIFMVTLSIPVNNYHPNIQPVSTVVSLGQYYQETLQEIFHPSPSNSPSGNSPALFFSLLAMHLLASTAGGLVGLAIGWVLKRLGFEIQIGTPPPCR